MSLSLFSTTRLNRPPRRLGRVCSRSFLRRRAVPRQHRLNPRQTHKVASLIELIDQATAAAAAGRFEEARLLEQAAYQAAHQAALARVNPKGAPSPEVETALAQALPPSESATAADRPETVGKTDQPILFPKLAPQLPAGPSPLVEAPRATPPEPTAPGRVAALQRPIELPPASGKFPAAPSAPPEKPSPGLVQAEAGIACPPRDTLENAQTGFTNGSNASGTRPRMVFGSNGRNIAQAARSGTLCSRSRPASRKSTYLKTYLPPFGRGSGPPQQKSFTIVRSRGNAIGSGLQVN